MRRKEGEDEAGGLKCERCLSGRRAPIGRTSVREPPLTRSKSDAGAKHSAGRAGGQRLGREAGLGAAAC